MNSKEKIGLFIGRYQPAHFGTLDGLKQAAAQGITKVMFCVGSADKEFTENNPFKFDERKEMLNILSSDINSILSFDPNDVYPVTDFGDDKLWSNYIVNYMPKFDYVISGNPHVTKIFEGLGIPVINLEVNLPIKASIIRNHIAFENRQELLEFIPQSLIDYLEKIDAFTRLKQIYKKTMKPGIAVDGIIEDEFGNIILIRRKYPPYGFALPGGMVDYGESTGEALVREMKEELNIDVKIVGNEEEPFVLKSKGKRDPRRHIIAAVYKAKIVGGEIKAGDDAAEYIPVPKSEILNYDLAFDHKEIIIKYLAQEKSVRLRMLAYMHKIKNTFVSKKSFDSLLKKISFSS